MQSLTTLIRESRADDPIARALEALLDSGLIIFTRDTEGHFVQLSEVLSDRAGIIASPGASQPRNLRVFDEQGRLLPGSEYPAAITRITGAAQREVLRRLVSDDDNREIWLRMSTLPMERGPEGWSVLTVATDVTDLIGQVDAGKREIAARGALLALSRQIEQQSLSRDALTATFEGPLSTLIPGANIALAIRDGEGDEYETLPLVHGFGNPLLPRRGRYTTAQRDRWGAPNAHVNRDVQDTDIYGANVVAEFPHPMRSLIIAPCFRPGSANMGALVAYYDRPGAFTEDQVTSLEFAAHLFGDAYDASEPLAQAS
ncbi:MAG: hypothetical protein O3A10_07535 [Chloroflexi bacterium]|nr:hypothetical protein [Chloroflexota bacterium]MDA1145720.1 hypothetical protein [Chloroflexota bacterium]